MANPSGLDRYRVVGGRVLKTPSCNEILPRLYLGDICIATNKDEISKLGITDMITVEIRPLQAHELAPTVKRYLYINVMDHSKMDILSHFDTSNEFIESALKTPSNKVYVHCVAGISRSASLVIAYIMKTRSMNYTEAFELVSQKRRVIDPNEGFVRQLVLYHKMKCTIDIGNLEFRRMVLDALVFEFRLISLSYYQTTFTSKTTSSSSSSNTLSSSPGSTSSMSSLSGNPSTNIIQLPTHGHKNLTSRSNVGILFDQYYNKLNLQQVSKFPRVYDPQTAFKCNKCRAIVFYAISVIENNLPDYQKNSGLGQVGSGSGSRMLFDFNKTGKDQAKECSFVFIEPQPWMSKNVLERDGNLECYKCKRKLGKFDWTSGESCSCPRHNSHMNSNLFKIMKKKVDQGGTVAIVQ